MSNKMWEVLIEHSKTCALSGKLYVYYPDEPRNVGVIFNNIYVFSGLIAGEQFHSVDSLSDSQKVFVDTLVKKAYDNWMHVLEYDSKSLLGFDQNKSSPFESDLRIHAQDQLNSFDQLSVPNLQASIPPENLSMNPGLTIGGYHDNIGDRYPPIQPQNPNLHVALQLDGTSFPHDQLALGQPISTTPSFPTASTSNLTSYRGMEDIPEDEIRVRSHEMLEHEDMQHLLRMFSMGGHTPFSGNEHNYYSAYTPVTPSTFGFGEGRTRSSGKAVVGWLKLKAALRWGIFIRKKAAERRAQIVELDDF
ncbi:hypothetical protein ACP275_13G153300 [Erythranthe tilingii]